MRRTCVFIFAAAVLACAAAPAHAAPDLQIPVLLSVNLPVPGKYWFKYAVFDRDGRNPADPGTEVWSEAMDILGPKLLLRSKKFKHLLGSISPLTLTNFNRQLWVQAFRWRAVEWVACSGRVKLEAQPYALFSMEADKLDGQEAAAFAAAQHTHSFEDLSCYVRRDEVVVNAGARADGSAGCRTGLPVFFRRAAISCGTNTPAGVFTEFVGFDESVAPGADVPSSCYSRFWNGTGVAQTAYTFAVCCPLPRLILPVP